MKWTRPKFRAGDRGGGWRLPAALAALAVIALMGCIVIAAFFARGLQTFVQNGSAVGGVKLAGMVVDGAGKPALNTTVLLLPFPDREHKTDGQGRFELTYNPNQFGAGANIQRAIIARDVARNLAAAVNVEEEGTNVSLRLGPGLTLAGRATDPGGKPIPNAQVSIQLWTGSMASPLGSGLTADAQGRFEAAGLPAGRHYAVNVSAEGFGPDNRNVEEADTATSRVDLGAFQLTPATLRIAGVVLDADDRPVAEAFVNSYGEKQPALNTRTDAKGRFHFDHVCPGPITLSAYTPSSGQFGNISAEGGDTNITLHLGSRQANFGAGNTRPRQKIKGTVLNTAGKPAPKVVISVFPDFSNSQKQTDEAGHFALALDPNPWAGSHRVMVARDLERQLAGAVEFDEEETNVNLRLEPGLTLAGHVTDLEGKTLANAEATITFWTANMGSSFGSAARANSQGEFEIKVLPPGRHYGITVSAKGFGQDSKNLEAADTAGPRVDVGTLQLSPANLRIAGVVLDADDKPVPGAFISGFGGNKQPQVNCQTDAKGRFHFDHVCAGAINLQASSPRVGGIGSVSAEGGETNITIHLGSQEANFGSGNEPPAAADTWPSPRRRWQAGPQGCGQLLPRFLERPKEDRRDRALFDHVRSQPMGRYGQHRACDRRPRPRPEPGRHSGRGRGCHQRHATARARLHAGRTGDQQQQRQGAHERAGPAYVPHLTLQRQPGPDGSRQCPGPVRDPGAPRWTQVPGDGDRQRLRAGHA